MKYFYKMFPSPLLQIHPKFVAEFNSNLQYESQEKYLSPLLKKLRQASRIVRDSFIVNLYTNGHRKTIGRHLRVITKVWKFFWTTQ